MVWNLTATGKYSVKSAWHADRSTCKTPSYMVQGCMVQTLGANKVNNPMFGHSW